MTDCSEGGSEYKVEILNSFRMLGYSFHEVIGVLLVSRFILVLISCSCSIILVVVHRNMWADRGVQAWDHLIEEGVLIASASIRWIYFVLSWDRTILLVNCLPDRSAFVSSEMFLVLGHVDKHALRVRNLVNASLIKVSSTPLQVVSRLMHHCRHFMGEIQSYGLWYLFIFTPESGNFVIRAFAHIALAFHIAKPLLSPKWTLPFKINLVCFEERSVD